MRGRVDEAIVRLERPYHTITFALLPVLVPPVGEKSGLSLILI